MFKTFEKKGIVHHGLEKYDAKRLRNQSEIHNDRDFSVNRGPIYVPASISTYTVKLMRVLEATQYNG